MPAGLSQGDDDGDGDDESKNEVLYSGPDTHFVFDASGAAPGTTCVCLLHARAGGRVGEGC